MKIGGLKFDPAALNMPRWRGPRLSVTNNADGTATLTMRGYVNTDTGGSTRWNWAFSPANLPANNADLADDGITAAYNATSQTLTINDTSTPRYFRFYAQDAGAVVIAASNIIGPITITGDTEAAALINVLKNTDGWAGDATKEAAIHNWFADNRADGILPYLGDVRFPLFGASAPNSRLWITRAAGTYTGMVTHNADGIKYDSVGAYFDWGVTPSALGLTASSNGLFVIRKNAPAAGAYVEIGANGGAGEVNMWLNYMSITLHRHGDGAGGTLVGTPIATNGMFIQSRYSATEAIAKNYDWADTVIGSSSSMSGSAFPAGANIYDGAGNNSGSPTGNTEEYYHGFGAIKGMNETQLDLFAINNEALLTAFGITI